MAYTTADLTTFLTNGNFGKAPTAAQSLLLASIATQTQSGALSDSDAIDRIVDMLDGTSAVAVQAYQFFTGGTPSGDGMDYLVDSTVNTNDLNDAAPGQYAALSTENRYINFAINLGASAAGAGKANFEATYGTLTFKEVAQVAYEAVIGTAAAQAAGINVTAAIDYLSRAENEAYLRAFVAQKAPGVNVELAIRAALVGQIMSAGATADVGNYNSATERLLVGALDGTLDGGITATTGVNLLTAFPNAPSAGKSFVLTANPDVAPAFAGSTGNDTFTATNTTLSAADSLEGGAGTDTLRYSSAGAVAVNQAGFTSAGIEVMQVTSDAVGGTTFDTSNASGVASLVNDNSSSDLTVTGLNAIAELTVRNPSQPTGATVNTTLNYNAAATAGATTTQKVTLENVFNPAVPTTTVSSVTANGVEIFNVVGAGSAASNLAVLASNSLATVNVSGAQGVTIGALTFAGATGTVDASANTGGVNVTLTNSGAADVAVTGGSGADRADFSAGFAAKDSFNGGAGTDTLAVTNAVATGALGGAASNIEVLEISAGGTGTVDMSKFAGVTSTVYTSTGIATGNSLIGATVVSKTGATQAVTVDAGTVANTLTVAVATDGASDALTLNVNKVGAADLLGAVTATDFDSVTVNIADDAAVAGVGALSFAGLTAAKAKSITVTNNTDVTATATVGGALLTSLDASASTGKLDLTPGVTTSLAGATIKLGSADDKLVVNATAGTVTGGDTITLGAGKDLVTYTAVAQSGDKSTDTITDFVSGTDKLDLQGLGLTTSTQNLGTRDTFGLSQGALTKVAGQAVFQKDAATLWIDNGDGQLDASDFRIVLTGNTALTNADLSLGTGASITLTAPAATANLTTATLASGKTTNESDTITTTIANLAGSTVGGGNGDDTLVISDAGTVAVPVTVTSVEALTLANGTNAVSLAGAATGIKTITGGTGADTVALGANFAAAGGAVSLGAGIDALTGVTVANLGLALTTYNGGADADTFTLAAAQTSAGVDLSGVSAFETLDLGQVAGGGLVTTAAKFASGVTTLIGDTTNGNITANMTAAQLDALTTITSAAAGNVFTVNVTDGGTVNLTDTTVTTLANVDNIAFATNSDVSIKVNHVMSGAGAADTVRVKADLGTLTLATTGFETVSVETAQTGTLTLAATSTTLNASVAGTFVLGGVATTYNGSGTAAHTVTGANFANTYNLTGTGAETITGGTAVDTLVAGTSTSAVTFTGGAGLDVVGLSTASSADVVSFADGAGTVGVVASVNRDVISNFSVVNDKIALDINQTTVGTAAAATPVLQVVAAAGAFTANNTADLTVLNFDLGGATNVIGAAIDGSAIINNTGTITVANNQVGYLLAYDGGNAYLYSFTNGADTALDATEIALIGTINTVAVSGLGVANFSLLA